jgi:hypothetical protein
VALTCSSPLALALACWGSGGGRSGSVVSASGVGSLGTASFGAGGLGARAAAAGFNLCLISLADLMKQTQLCYGTSREEQDVHCARKDLYLQRRLLHDSLLHSQSPWRLNNGTRCWWWGHTSWWCGAHHGDGNRSYHRS